jgi:hypothetical protein
MRVTLFILICLAAVGCRSDNRCSRETALLRAEILDLEDKYYLLKSEHEVAVSELNGFKGISDDVFYDDPIIYETELPNATMNYSGSPSSVVGLPGEPGTQQARFDHPSIIQHSGRSIPALDDFDLPASDGRWRGSGKFDSPADVDITEVLIDRSMTGGQNVDGNPGDEGIDLLIQPRTAAGSVSLQTGELTVSLIDPAESPDRQRIGLWKFLPGETELFFANDESGVRGILLHLPWEERSPVNQRLIVHVRFIPRGGQTLTTSGELRISPPADDYSAGDPQVCRWTELDPRWISQQDRQATNSAPTKTAIQMPSWRPIR